MRDRWQQFWVYFAAISLISGASTFLMLRDSGKAMEQQQEMREALKSRRKNKDNRQH